jgi:hypothetical protein
MLVNASCRICKVILLEDSAILVGPPDEEGFCRRSNFCMNCYSEISIFVSRTAAAITEQKER